jgi:hypothetical protein
MPNPLPQKIAAALRREREQAPDLVAQREFTLLLQSFQLRLS